MIRSAAVALAVAGLLSACSSGTHPSTTATASATLPPSSPSASAPPTPRATQTPSASPSAVAGVPADFAPLSASFVSTSAGFALGTTACGAATCIALARTADGGHTWSALPPPPLPATGAGQATPVRHVRFADARDGWAFGNQLWSTHDGGAHWARVPLPDIAEVQSVEAAAGAVHALVVDSGAVRILDSPVATDAWKGSTTTIPLGAGPVPQAQLSLQGSAGWAIEVDRTVVGGAQLNGGRWTSWQPPCSSAGGFAALGAAAAATSRLDAVCVEGTYNGPAQSVHLYVSSDGGGSFQRIAAALPVSTADGLAVATQSTVVVSGHSANGDVLLGSFDGGAHWSTVYSGEQVRQGELGFTTATQGVAATGTHLLMTYDGGHHWDAVSFH